MITTIISILESPAIAITPSVERTQIIRSTIPSCLRGFGKAPIAQRITANIKRSQSLMSWPFIAKRGKFGIGKLSILMYPKNQRTIRARRSASNIFLLYHRVKFGGGGKMRSVVRQRIRTRNMRRRQDSNLRELV